MKEFPASTQCRRTWMWCVLGGCGLARAWCAILLGLLHALIMITRVRAQVQGEDAANNSRDGSGTSTSTAGGTTSTSRAST
eukprot:GSA25T00019902001.1